MEKEQLVHFVELSTLSRIAKATNSKLVVNINYYFVMGLLFTILILLCIVCLSPLISDIKQYEKNICAVILIEAIVLGIMILNSNINSRIYIITKERKKIDIYKYRLEMMYLYLLNERFISKDSSNHLFYQSILNTIKDKVRPIRPINFAGIISICGIVLPSLCFIFSGIENLISKILIVYTSFIVFIITLIIYMIFLLFFQIKNNNYNLLNSIIQDLLIKDCIKHKK